MAAINAVKIFSGSASNYLAKDIAKYYGKDLGAATILKFSDGEMSPSFDESVRGCDVFIIQSTFPSSDNLMELLLMIDAARRASAHYVTAVMPYFGYSRQDRKDRPRVGIGACFFPPPKHMIVAPYFAAVAGAGAPEPRSDPNGCVDDNTVAD